MNDRIRGAIDNVGNRGCYGTKQVAVWNKKGAKKMLEGR